MESLEEVCAHVDDVPDRGLTIEKIRDWGEVLNVTEEAVVFEVERHTRAGGALRPRFVLVGRIVGQNGLHTVKTKSGRCQGAIDSPPNSFSLCNALTTS